MIEPLIVLTVRMGSARQPGKVCELIGSKALFHHIYERLSEVGLVTVAFPDENGSPLRDYCKINDLRYYLFKGDPNDVLGRITNAALSMNVHDGDYVMRGLGDCPFPVPEFILRATNTLRRCSREVFAWMLPTWVWPVYGSREFPMAWSAWQKELLSATIEEHEHPDMCLHRHRDKFSFLYHEPPRPNYFRPHRVEVDYSEDLEVIKGLYERAGHWPSLEEALSILDSDSTLRSLNAHRSELTGPNVSYSLEDRAQWAQSMTGVGVMLWNDEFYVPQRGDSKPVFCDTGSCLLGYTARGWLYTLEGHSIKGTAKIDCKCGAGRYWHEAK